MSTPRLLIVSCNPPQNHPFDADRIASDVRRALGDGAVRVELRPDLHFEELGPFVGVLRPTLLNFIGHGLPEGRLVMKDRDGVARDFDPDAVAFAAGRGASLDVDRDQPSQVEVERQLPAERRGERLWLRLSDHFGPRLDRVGHAAQSAARWRVGPDPAGRPGQTRPLLRSHGGAERRARAHGAPRRARRAGAPTVPQPGTDLC